MTAEPTETRSWRLGEDDLRRWLDRLLQQGVAVVAPAEDGPVAVYQALAGPEEASLEARRTAWSPKDQLLPRTESLYSFTFQDGGPQLLDPTPPERDTVLFGVLSCDAAGFARLDETFLDLSVIDPLYAERRRRTTVVSLACHEAALECFCASVGGSPHGTEGVDLRLIPLGDTWLATALTQKGEAVADPDWVAASLPDFESASRLEEKVAATMESTFLPLLGSLEDDFESPVYRELGRRCQSCGACAYVCPSCTCFDVSHESNAWGGRVIRSWDSCTFGLFTLHASGHNPRPDPATRYRQRLLHKFAYRENGAEPRPRCVGCGRCVAACPAGIDIHHAVRRLLARPEEEGSHEDG